MQDKQRPDTPLLCEAWHRFGLSELDTNTTAMIEVHHIGYFTCVLWTSLGCADAVSAAANAVTMAGCMKSILSNLGT